MWTGAHGIQKTVSGALELEIIGGSKPPNTGVGIKLQSPRRAVSAFNQEATCPVLYI